MCEAGRSFPYVNTHTRHRQASPTTVCMHGIGGVAAEYYLLACVCLCVYSFFLRPMHVSEDDTGGKGMAWHNIA